MSILINSEIVDFINNFYNNFDEDDLIYYFDNRIETAYFKNCNQINSFDFFDTVFNDIIINNIQNDKIYIYYCKESETLIFEDVSIYNENKEYFLEVLKNKIFIDFD